MRKPFNQSIGIVQRQDMTYHHELKNIYSILIYKDYMFDECALFSLRPAKVLLAVGMKGESIVCPGAGVLHTNCAKYLQFTCYRIFSPILV